MEAAHQVVMAATALLRQLRGHPSLVQVGVVAEAERLLVVVAQEVAAQVEQVPLQQRVLPTLAAVVAVVGADLVPEATVEVAS